MITVAKPLNGVHKRGEADITLKNFQDEVDELTKGEETPASSSFPVQVFPKVIREFIAENVLAFELPPEYYGTVILTISASIIGNSFLLKYKNGYDIPTTLYSAIIGHPSSGKTPAMKACLVPVNLIEEQMDSDYRGRLAEWEVECDSLSKGRSHPPKPKRKELMVNDSTIEALNEVLTNNPNGLMMTMDELLGWVNGMNQYRKGADEQFWLSNWSNNPVKVNRVSKETIFIPKPNISVIGGMQPDLLKSLGAGDKRNSGFLYRILFAFPTDLKKNHRSDHQPKESTISAYKDLILNLFELTKDAEDHFTENQYITVLLDDGARPIFEEWKGQLIKKSNEDDCGSTMSINGKMEQYCLRFALTLFVLEQVGKGGITFSKPLKIGEPLMQKAILLSEYYLRNAFRVLNIIDDIDPLTELSELKRKAYQILPPTFSTKEGEGITARLGLKKRTYQRFLKDKSLFLKLTRGRYAKNV